MLTVQFGAVPQIVILPFGTSVVFDELADNAVAQTRVVSTSLMVTATLFFGVSSLVVWSATLLMVGASFTAVTVKTKLSCADNEPSLTVSVTVLVPFWFVAGFILTVQFG